MATRTVDLGSVIGPQGPQGPRGAAGAAGARGPRGRGSARLVVGVSTAGWTANDCDYLCDGTSDEVQIGNAISALPSTGGEIVFLDGTYNFSEVTVAQSNVTLTGNRGTVMKGEIIVQGDHCVIQGLCFSNTSNTVKITTGNYCAVRNNHFTWCTYAIYVTGAVVGTMVTNNLFTHAENAVMMTASGSGRTLIANNVIDANWNDGIQVSGTSGIVVGNLIYEPYCGIRVNGSKCLVTGNTIVPNADETYYSIEVLGSNNLICTNMVYGKNYTNTGTGNTFANNKYN